MFLKRKLIATLMIGAVVLGAAITSGSLTQVSAAAEKTGTGLADHVMKAYNEGWKYSYGAYGQKSGGTRITDCSGLIKSYLWWTDDSSNPKAGSISVGGGASAMLNSSKEKGTIDYSDYSSLPRTHGLILYQPGHVGVYVGNNMAVDNRDYGYDIKYEKVFGRSRNKWTTWFKLPQITYPTTGFYTFNGNKYYYENGEYVVKTSKVIGDMVYTFGDDGVLVSEALTPEAEAEKLAQITAPEAPAEPDAPDQVPEKGMIISAFPPEDPMQIVPGSPAAKDVLAALSADPADATLTMAQAAPAEAAQAAESSGFPGAAAAVSFLGLCYLATVVACRRKAVKADK